MKLSLNYISHKFTRFFQRISLKLIRLSNQNDEPKKGEYEYECLSICKSLIKNEKTKLLISPISKKRYINSNDKQVFIIIDNRMLTIVNHQYSYNIQLTLKSFERLSDLFDNEVEKRRESMEDEIRSNVKHSLTNIYQKIVNENV